MIIVGMVEKCPLCYSDLKLEDKDGQQVMQCSGPTCSYSKVVKRPRLQIRKGPQSEVPLSYRQDNLERERLDRLRIKR